MRERVIEQKLIQAVRRSGGLALKLNCPGFSGVPDRLLLFRDGKMAFCEVKAPGQKPRPLQVHRMEQLRSLGFKVFVIDGMEQIGGMIREIRTGKGRFPASFMLKKDVLVPMTSLVCTLSM